MPVYALRFHIMCTMFLSQRFFRTSKMCSASVRGVMVLLMFMLVVMGVKVQSEDTLPTVPVTAMRYQRWRNRTIMQGNQLLINASFHAKEVKSSVGVLTDRMWPGHRTAEEVYGEPYNLNQYCGGNWEGSTAMLDYIQDLGIDAVWFSPHIEQTKSLSLEYPDGYHGYWPKNLWQVNNRFGSKNDLLTFIRALHARGMLAMLDVVMNHSGYGEYNEIAVFNDSKHYHDCTGCITSEYGLCSYNVSVLWQSEHCRMLGLLDLNQSEPFVGSTLINWLCWTERDLDVDAFRVDAARHTWRDWLTWVPGNVSSFVMGEYYCPDVDEYISFVGPPSLTGKPMALNAGFNFPLYFTLQHVFRDLKSMDEIRSLLRHLKHNLGEMVHYQGVFFENHDFPRFLSSRFDVRLYQNAHAFVLFTEGIPIVYYGAEQGMQGQRDPLWALRPNSGQTRNDLTPRNYEMYRFLKALIQARKMFRVWDYEQHELNITVLEIDQYSYANISSSNLYVFQRGPAILVIHNLKADLVPDQGIMLIITGINMTELGVPAGSTLYSALCNSTQEIVQQGWMTVSIGMDRRPLVFIPSQLEGMGADYIPAYFTG